MCGVEDLMGTNYDCYFCTFGIRPGRTAPSLANLGASSLHQARNDAALGHGQHGPTTNQFQFWDIYILNVLSYNSSLIRILYLVALFFSFKYEYFRYWNQSQY